MERISLSNAAFEGNNNVYLLPTGSETVLIDTGDHLQATREQLESGLAEHGLDFSDIDCIFLSHWHADHAGLAGTIQAESDARVYVHSNDAPLVEGRKDAWTELHATLDEYCETWGLPDEKRSELKKWLSGRESMGEPPTVTTIEDGDTFSFDGIDLTVNHVSGHSAGLCMFELDLGRTRQVATGDALLPVYTPNVGGADVRVQRPLDKYLTALRNIVDGGYSKAWPGHRDPIDDPSGRAVRIIRHHEERSERVLKTLDRCGPSEVWTVSDELFGDLEQIHILHGPGEAYAHLDYLERRGTVIRGDNGYRLADDCDRFWESEVLLEDFSV